MNKDTIKIDIVSDIACPWCYVGKRRLESAIEQWQGGPVEVNWHPYQLDPTIPDEGLDWRTYLTNKFGSEERLNKLLENLINVGKEVGIEFNLKDRELSINTLLMHKILHVAGQEGLKNQVKGRLFKAYFEEDVDLHTKEGLSSIMAEFGWSEEKVVEIINSDDIAYQIKQEIAYFQQNGVSGVPFFIINNKHAVRGAQPSEVFLEVFEAVSPQTIVADQSCDIETGEC